MSAAASGAWALEAAGLTKSFGGLMVTRNVDLQLAPGERRALIGPNGAGKSTLVALLSGVLTADAGSIRIHGQDITRLSPAQRVKLGLARTFQITSLFPGLSVIENVYLAVSERLHDSARLWRPARSRRQVLDEVTYALNEVGLYERRHTQVESLAYGEQRLLELAMGIALQPRVLLLDEPAAGIPSSETEGLMRALEKLPSDMAILLIDHDMQLIRRFAQTVTVLVEGQVLLTGPAAEVMASSKVHEAYLGRGGVTRAEADHA